MTDEIGETKMGIGDPNVDRLLSGEHDLRIGKAYGNVIVEERIGWGGMGEIYRGRHSLLDQQMAVKIPRSGDRVVLARMITEARSQSALKGPHIVPVKDAGLDPEPYITMEYIEGSETLEEYCNTSMYQIFDPGHLLQLLTAFKQVLITLNNAHHNKDKEGKDDPITHRDVKPANILVVKEGHGKLHPYVIDWGLVKKQDDNNLTAESDTVGTLYHMAPEQMRGKDKVGPKSDVYSAVTTLYWMMTGAHIYKSKDSEVSVTDMGYVEFASFLIVWWKEPDQLQERIDELPKELGWLKPILSRGLLVDSEERMSMAHFIKLVEMGIVDLQQQMKDRYGGVTSSVISRPRSDDRTVEIPTVTEQKVKEMKNPDEKSGFGRLASLLLLVILVLIGGSVGLYYAFGGGSEPQQQTNKSQDAGMRKFTSRAEVVNSPRKRIRPKPLPPPPKGHIMPSDPYIELLFHKKLKTCKQKADVHKLNCMRKIIRHLYWSGYKGTAILLFDQTYPWFCFYHAKKFDKTIREECKRAWDNDRPSYFKLVSGVQVGKYNDRLKGRMEMRNRIRRERIAWFKKKYNLK